MATYETVREETRTFEPEGYLEVARKRLTDGPETAEFLVVTRGHLAPDGTKRWTRFVTTPADEPTRRWLAEAILRA